MVGVGIFFEYTRRATVQQRAGGEFIKASRKIRVYVLVREKCSSVEIHQGVGFFGFNMLTTLVVPDDFLPPCEIFTPCRVLFLLSMLVRIKERNPFIGRPYRLER